MTERDNPSQTDFESLEKKAKQALSPASSHFFEVPAHFRTRTHARIMERLSEKETSLHFWKRLSLGLGTLGLVLSLGIGALLLKNQNQIQTLALNQPVALRASGDESYRSKIAFVEIEILSFDLANEEDEEGSGESTYAQNKLDLEFFMGQVSAAMDPSNNQRSPKKLMIAKKAGKDYVPFFLIARQPGTKKIKVKYLDENKVVMDEKTISFEVKNS